MLEVGEASAKILNAISALEMERVSLENAVGLVLSRKVVAATTSPPWDNSSMDGYAVRSTDVVSSPRLKVVATIAAGRIASRPLGAGEAMRIMTGAPLPLGADSVIRIEDTDAGRDRVTIREFRDLQKNIRRAGEDFRERDTLFEAGTEIRAAHLGVLAAAAITALDVHGRPRVAVISSGDELVELRD